MRVVYALCEAGEGDVNDGAARGRVGRGAYQVRGSQAVTFLAVTRHLEKLVTGVLLGDTMVLLGDTMVLR